MILQLLEIWGSETTVLKPIPQLYLIGTLQQLALHLVWLHWNGLGNQNSGIRTRIPPFGVAKNFGTEFGPNSRLSARMEPAGKGCFRPGRLRIGLETKGNWCSAVQVDQDRLLAACTIMVLVPTTIRRLRLEQILHSQPLPCHRP
jgi:hypothetical protein